MSCRDKCAGTPVVTAVLSPSRSTLTLCTTVAMSRYSRRDPVMASLLPTRMAGDTARRAVTLPSTGTSRVTS